MVGQREADAERPLLARVPHLYRLLTPSQQARLLRLQLLVVLMALLEVASVFSVAPFMALVTDPTSGADLPGSSALRAALGTADAASSLSALAALVLVVLAMSTLTATWTIWRLVEFANSVGASFATRLYRHYLRRDWLFHATTHSSDLQARISQEALRLTVNVLKPAVELNAQLVKGTLIAVALLLFDPRVALAAALLLTVAYGGIYLGIRKRLARHGRTMTSAQQERFRLMAEGLGGIRDVLLLDRAGLFEARFAAASDRFARGVAVTQMLGIVPRYAMEFVALGSVVTLVLFLLAEHDGDLSLVLPGVSVFAFAGFKMLPAFQQVYASLSMMRSHVSALDALEPDLLASLQAEKRDAARRTPAAAEEDEVLSLRDALELRDVHFAYPGKEQAALDGIDVTIPARGMVAFVGASGSGKSTLIDLLLGLLRPQRGELLVDGRILTDALLPAWQRGLGFVPQDIFLADASLRENIAFGLPPEQVDPERIERAVEAAQLAALVDQLPEGLATRVGERGVQLSGGQRQRIGIARALYRDASLLVLDEATSALDGITEQAVMEALQGFARDRTIVMVAHRLATVRSCDRIHLLDAGRIVDAGRYDELIARSQRFRDMALRS
jgi:HlyD family secretion protein